MWPDAFEEWYDDFLEACREWLRGRLSTYSILTPFRESLITKGMQRTWEIGEYLQAYPSYFRHKYEFIRWMKVTSYRETLRLVLDKEHVEAVVEGLPEPTRRLIRHRYIDQFTDEDVARVFDLRKGGPVLFDVRKGRDLSIGAYIALCEGIGKRALAAGPPVGSPYRDYTSIFPLFPGPTRDQFPH